MPAARSGDVVLAYETLGPPDGVPLLLISGTGVQMLIWPDEFCAALADCGFQLARFDNRDAGLSTHLTAHPTPGWLKVLLHPASAPYRLDDMAGDAVAVLDALGWPSAHIVGTSLGGMIAQVLAIRHPARVRTITSIMSTPSARIGTMPTIRVMRVLAQLAGHPATSPEQAADQAVTLKRADDADLRQRAAVVASGDRRGALAGLRLPALVIHGQQDPMIRPRAGRATAAAIPGAKLVSYPGMGHDLPRELWPTIVAEIGTLAGQPAPAGARAGG
jgi:pimeloyl-ACP methyl ester carboxylesterase